MSPEGILARYADAFDKAAEPVVVRLYTGTAPGRTFVDHAVRARVVKMDAEPLVGPISQGACELIVSAADVQAAGITLTTGANCKVVVRGKELQITSIDDNSRRGAGAFAAYELTAGGKVGG